LQITKEKLRPLFPENKGGENDREGIQRIKENQVMKKRKLK